MTVILFRPFKRMDDGELLQEIYKIFELLKDQPGDQAYFQLCDQLVREAKIRELECPKDILLDRILYR